MDEAASLLSRPFQSLKNSLIKILSGRGGLFIKVIMRHPRQVVFNR